MAVSYERGAPAGSALNLDTHSFGLKCKAPAHHNKDILDSNHTLDHHNDDTLDTIITTHSTFTDSPNSTHIALTLHRTPQDSFCKRHPPPLAPLDFASALGPDPGTNPGTTYHPTALPTVGPYAIAYLRGLRSTRIRFRNRSRASPRIVASTCALCGPVKGHLPHFCPR